MKYEIEQKYPLDDVDRSIQRLHQIGYQCTGVEINEDDYFNHPCKDFVHTGEALRVRRIDGRGHATYKGPKFPGAIKAREELEWEFGAGDADGSKMCQLLTTLDFRLVATVRKTRSVFRHDADRDLVVVVDDVEQLGNWAEIEMVVSDIDEVDVARQRIAALADKLGLTRPESRSYLRMLVARQDTFRQQG